jgi:hypothetical protein
MPSLEESRAPADPPSITPMAVSRWQSRAVLRAQGATTPGKRSVKICRVQCGLSQKSLRTPSPNLTRQSPQGRSASVRWYWL